MNLQRAMLDHLEPARRALAEGRYEAAFALLEHAALGPLPHAVRATCHLHLAAADALYGQDGLDRGLRSLRDAAAADPGSVRWPLYRALHWEFRSMQGASASEVRRGVSGIGRDDPVAGYHAASALWWAGAARSARRALEALEEDDLPAYLQWRRASLLGHALADEGDFAAAADAFRSAFGAASRPERETARLHYAHALLEQGKPDEGRELLQQLVADDLAPGEAGWAHELRGLAELAMGNPVLALERFESAERLSSGGDRRFAVAQAQAQALSRLGRHAEAADRLAVALAEASADDRPFALHERAIALLEADLLGDAEEVLNELLLDPDYPHHAEATADLAEVRLRQGDLIAARSTASHALELGATGPACLTLGTVALEYFDLDEAIVWLERAASAAVTGDPTWVAAQQLLADAHAQRGPAAAERLLMHARQALAWTEPGSEWHGPLLRHVSHARAQLGGHDRLLN